MVEPWFCNPLTAVRFCVGAPIFVEGSSSPVKTRGFEPCMRGFESHPFCTILINVEETVMSKQKKTLQLGMNPSTASGRLVKDTLFRLAVELGHKCFQCGEDLERDSFSIEHKEPWLDSTNPKATFFDQDNIAFSHLSCNIGQGRRGTTPCPSNAAYNRGCRCDGCKAARRAKGQSSPYCKDARKERYLRLGT